jgi:hypothetical protein
LQEADRTATKRFIGSPLCVRHGPLSGRAR